MSTLTQRVSVLGASTAVAGAALLGGVPMTHMDTTGLFHSVQREVGLVADHILLPPTDPTIIPDFAQSLKFLMDGMLGIGQSTLPTLLDPNGTTTLEGLLAPTGLILGDATTPGSDMTDVFNALGLNNIQLGTVLGLLGIDDPGTDKFGDLLASGGALEGLGGLSLSDLIGGLAPGGGDGSAMQIVDLVDALGMGQQTLGGLLSELSTTDNQMQTMGDLFTALAIPGLQGFLPLLGLESTSPITGLLTTLGLDGSLHSLLAEGGMLDSVGTMTLGTLLGFDNTTTLGDVLGGLKFADPDDATQTLALSKFTFSQLLGEVQLNPTDSLAKVLGDLPLGLNDQSLGDTSLADFLTGMTSDGQGGHVVVDNTTGLGAFLTDAGMGTLTLDDWIGLGSGVDISNWFGDPVTP